MKNSCEYIPGKSTYTPKYKYTKQQLKIMKQEEEFYSKVDKALKDYDKVVEAVSKGSLDKTNAYYSLCRILFEFKKIYDI